MRPEMYPLSLHDALPIWEILGLDTLHQLGRRGHQPLSIGLLLKSRRNLLTNDPPGHDVWNRTLQAIPDLDTQFAILNGRHQQHPIIGGLATYPPFLKHPHRIAVNILTL